MTTMKRHGATTLAGLSILCLAGAVWAATSTNVPGAACVAIEGASLTVNSDGEAVNLGGQLVTAVCPAERPIGSGGTSKASGTVFVIDRSPAENVCCWMVSQNPGGSRIESNHVCSASSSNVFQTLALPQVTDGRTFSHFVVECDVPGVSGGAASRILTYRITQE
jgi:hypothetical protein